MDAGYSSDGSTVFPSERPHESQFGGFETGSYSLDERSWADETEWTTPDKFPFQDLSEWMRADKLPSPDLPEWLKRFDEVLLAVETNEIAGSAMNGGPMDSLNVHQSNQIETSEASFQTETGGGGKSNLTPAQREKKRKNDAKYRKNIEEKIRLLHGLVPGGSKVTQKVQMLDETINYVRSLQRQVEEAAEQIAENKHLKKENEQLNAENTRLKDQLGLLVKQHQHQSVSVLLGNDQHATNFEAVDKEIVPVNAASLMSEGYIILPNVNECQFNVESQLNATEAPRDSCLQVEEIPHNNDRGSESLFPSNEEAKQGTCGSHNQYDEDEFSVGAEEEPFADGIGGEPSAKVLSSNKRKRSIEDAEVDQVKRGLEEKDSDESPEKRDCNLTTTTYMSSRKEGRGGCQASDPPKVEYIHIQAGRGQTNNSISRAKRAAIQNINERMKILQDLVPGCSKVAGKVPVLDEIINYLQSLQRQVEFLSMKLSAFNSVSNGNADAASTDILMKLEADDESTVKFSDFTGLDGERIKVGKYSVPLSLHPIVQNIIDDYGDVTATCKMNPCAAEANYVMFCASIKEMSDLRLKQVTEDRILKWRDAINDALRINFKVDFAKKHLKKVTCAYIGLIERRKLDNVALRIVHFEAQFRAGKEEHAKICTQSKAFMDAAEEFNEKPVSSGIFQSLPVICRVLSLLFAILGSLIFEILFKSILF